MHPFLAWILFLMPRTEPLQALDIEMGASVVYHEPEEMGFSDDVFAGPNFELSFVQRSGALWIEFGASGLAVVGTAMNSGARKEKIEGLGLHWDVALSLLQSRHVDLKIGGGAAAWVLQRVSELDSVHPPSGSRYRSSHGSVFFKPSGRITLALNIHRPDEIGGLEIRPFKAELGPSFGAFTPSVALYWPI